MEREGQREGGGGEGWVEMERGVDVISTKRAWQALGGKRGEKER
jgi:hypothetical protein